MANIVLITYASKYGATQEIAEKVGEVLKKEGITVDVVPMKKVNKLADYQSVIIGSAVYIGQWYKPTTKFLQKNEKTLAAMPVWIFSSGPFGKGDPVELLKGWKFPLALKPMIDRINPREIVVFGGTMLPEKMSGMEKWIVKRVGGETGDFRDWEMINTWAKKVAKEIKK